MSKVASITRAGGLIVNPQHATASTTQYAQGYISEGAVVTDGLKLYLDIADYASWPGSRSLATTWVDQSTSQAQHFDIVGDDGVILLGTYTSWAGRFPATIAATGNHIVMFDYWSDNDSVTWSIDNDGVNNNDYNTTLTANKKKQTFSKTVNLTATGSSTMFMRPHATGSKIYIANYRFFIEAGWNDLSGNGQDATLTGSPVFNCTNDPPIHYLTFDGTDDYTTIADSTNWDFSNGDFTLEAWIHPTSMTDSSGNSGTIICQDDNNVSKAWNLRLNSNATLLLRYTTDGSNENDITSSATGISINNWYHVLFVRSSNTYAFYVNGVAKGTGSLSATIYNSSTSVLVVARGGPNLYFTGRMGILRIYKGTGLAAAQVKQNFNAERNRFGI